MTNSKHAQRLEAAITWAEGARYDALRRARESATPYNPYRARDGQGAEYAAAKKEAFALGVILTELKARRREDRAEEALRFADRALDVFIGVGLTALAALGLAAAFVLLRLPEPVAQVTAVVGVGVALARTVTAARK